MVDNITVADFRNLQDIHDVEVVAFSGASSAYFDAEQIVDIKTIDGEDLASQSVRVYATSGNDNINVSGWTLNQWTGGEDRVYIFGYGGNDTLRGSSGDDSINGGPLDDTLIGGGGNDILLGTTGNDLLQGSTDDDTLVGGAGNDNLYGGGGNDVASYRDGSGGLNATMSDSFPFTINASSIGLGVDTLQAGTDGLEGTNYDDTLTGNSSNNILIGRDGSDFLSGGIGNDSLLGGDDWDGLTGGPGDDTLDGGSGPDTAHYNTETNNLNIDLSTGTASGTGIGTDTLISISNIDSGSGNDTITGDNSRNVLEGNGGSDSISGLGGDDTIKGGSGSDIVDGGAGNDTIEGGDGNNTLLGANGNDIFDYTTVNSAYGDSIDGGSDTDSIYIGDNGFGGVDFRQAWGIDNIEEISINDGMIARFGINRFDTTWDIFGDPLPGTTETLEVHGSFGNDEIDINTNSFSDWVSGEDDIKIFGEGGNDTIKGSNTYADSIEGGNDDDTLIGNGGNDIIFGEAGNDLIFGNNDNDSIDGGTENDTLYGGSGNDTLFGGAGNDTLNGENNIDTVDYSNASFAVDVDLTRVGAPHAIKIANGTDSLIGIENIIGSPNSDTIIGNDMDNEIVGGTGNDTISGGQGMDTLTGGSGPDVFTYAEDELGDVITDFNVQAPGMRDDIRLDAEIGGLFSEAMTVTTFAPNIYLVTNALWATGKTFLSTYTSINIHHLFTYSNIGAFTSAMQGNVSLASTNAAGAVVGFAMVGPGTGTNPWTLVAAVGNDTDGDFKLETFSTFNIAQLENITGSTPLGLGANQISYDDIIIF
jgi:Ca2+-binding RTX toxin-like protein